MAITCMRQRACDEPLARRRCTRRKRAVWRRRDDRPSTARTSFSLIVSCSAPPFKSLGLHVRGGHQVDQVLVTVGEVKARAR